MMWILLVGCLYESFSREGHCVEQRKPCLSDTLDKFDLCCWCRQAKFNDFKVPYCKSHKAQREMTWSLSGVRSECECWECVQEILIKTFFPWWITACRLHPYRDCTHTETTFPQSLYPHRGGTPTNEHPHRDCTHIDTAATQRMHSTGTAPTQTT